MNSKRYLTNGYTISNNSYETRLNNNDLVCGATGCGKTRGYVIPNLRMAEQSMIVCDTKGVLYGEYAQELRQKGYEVLNIDFVSESSPCGYNPFRYIRKNTQTGLYREDDIYRVASVLCPVEHKDDVFWEQAAKMFLAALIAYTLEALPEEYHTFETVRKLSVIMGQEREQAAIVHEADKYLRSRVQKEYMVKFRKVTDRTDENGKDVYLMSQAEIADVLGEHRRQPYTYRHMIDELKERNPDSIAVKIYNTFKATANAEKMYASILGIIAEKLAFVVGNEQVALYRHKKQIDFEEFGKRKMMLFLTVSDSDRTKDVLVNMLYSQALSTLMQCADQNPKHRLEMPVRLILDDFAAGAVIPDFDNIISVIRSREISVSVIIQSVTQLYDKYGVYKAATILNNCDHMIYLGGQDLDTAEYVARRTNKTLSSIIEQPLNATYLLERGRKAVYLQGEDVITMQKGGMSYEK